MFAHHRGYLKTGLSFALLLVMGTTMSAQSDPQNTKVFTLEEAVEFALKNYPAVRASLERLRAAQAGVGLARTAYLPRTDILWQTNRATDNNITGLTTPNTVIAPITGPVPLSPSNQSAWGSAGGLLFSWEPLDFGSRGARVDAARAVQNRASAEASLTRLDVTVATVNAYLTLLAAEQTVRAAQADAERRETFSKSVHVLVDNQLRAGADASRADAELARARVNLAEPSSRRRRAGRRSRTFSESRIRMWKREKAFCSVLPRRRRRRRVPSRRIPLPKRKKRESRNPSCSSTLSAVRTTRSCISSPWSWVAVAASIRTANFWGAARA